MIHVQTKRKQSMSRRQFLKTSAATAAGLGITLAGADTWLSSGLTRAYGQAQRAPTLVQGVDPETLDPHFGESGVMANVLFNIFEPLVNYDRKMRLQPVLAES
jgi:ABC-type transport system substrate-binding protein